MRTLPGRLYERINFLPFADAMFSGVAILIILLVSFSQKSFVAVSRPQADMVLRCDIGPSGRYTVTFVTPGGDNKTAAGKTLPDDDAAAEIERQLALFPELSARLLLLEYPGNWYCTDKLKERLEQLRDKLAEDGRSGKAIPLMAVSYLDGAVVRGAQGR